MVTRSGGSVAQISHPRILAFDIMRGIFMTSIIINHLGAAFGVSLLILLTGGGGLPASAAEGFFLISGTMVGYVYGPKILISTRSIFKKLWRRAGWLYVLCVFFTLLYTVWTLYYPGNEKFLTLYPRDGFSFLYNTFLLRYAFGWADFLSRYAWFMLAAPFILWLIAKKKSWIVAGVSFFVWVALRNVEALLPFAAWQIIFVIGIFFGYYYPKIVEWYRSISETKRRHIYKTVTSVTGITFSVSLVCFTLMPHLGELFPVIQGSFLWNITEYVRVPIAPYIDKNTLEPLRLAVAIGWFVGIYIFIRHHEKVINKYSRRFFELFGKNSLYVYGWHAFILFLIEIYIKPTGGSTNIWLSTLVAILVLSVIYLLTKYRHILVRKKKQLIGALSVNEVS